MLAELSGRYLANRSLKNKAAQFFQDIQIPSAYNKAIEFFRNKLVMPKSEFNKLDAAMRRQAFTVAATEKDVVLENVKSSLQNALESGQTIEDWRSEIGSVFDNAGVTGLNNYYLNNIFRTNIQTAYNAGKEAIYDGADEDEFPLREFHTVEDERVREEHARLNGFKAPKNDPIWQKITPPLTYNCRCTTSLVHKDEGLKASNFKPNLEGRGFDFIGKSKITKQKILKSVPPKDDLAGILDYLADQGKLELDDIKVDISEFQKYANQKAEEYVKLLNDEEKLSIINFKESGYKDINEFARTDIDAIYRDASSQKELDNLLKGESANIKRHYKQLYKNYHNLGSAIEKGQIDDDLIVWRGMRGAPDNPLGMIGDIMEDKGFWSTSLDEDMAKSFMNRSASKDNVLLKIKVKKGHKAAFPEYGKHNVESEILFKQAKFKITGAFEKENYWLFEGELL